MKALVGSVVRSALPGERHGGLYAVDTDTGWSERVLDWDRDISWKGHGGDRGLRGLTRWGDDVLVAASDEVVLLEISRADYERSLKRWKARITRDRVAFLKKTHTFRFCTDEDLGKIVGSVRVCTFAPGQVIVRQGDAGACGIEHADRLVGELAPGDIAMRQRHRGMDRFLQHAYPVVLFQLAGDAAQHLRGNGLVRLLHLHDLKPAGQRRVLLEVFLVL